MDFLHLVQSLAGPGQLPFPLSLGAHSTRGREDGRDQLVEAAAKQGDSESITTQTVVECWLEVKAIPMRCISWEDQMGLG